MKKCVQYVVLVVLVFALGGTEIFGQQVFVSGLPLMQMSDESSHLEKIQGADDYIGSVTFNSDETWLVGRTFTDLKVIDPASGQVVDSIERKLSFMVPSDDPEVIYGVYGDHLFAVNIHTGETDSLFVKGASHLARRPNTNELWITSGSQVTVVSFRNQLEVLGSITVNESYKGFGELRFDASGSNCVMVNWTSKSITSIDPLTWKVSHSLSHHTNPAGVELSADGRHLFFTCASFKRLYKVEMASMRMVDSTALPSQVFGIYRHPELNELWVMGHFDATIFRVDQDDLNVLGEMNVGASPWDIAFQNNSQMLGLQKKDAVEPLTAFPNPNRGLMTIVGLQPNVEWYLRDLKGSVIRQELPRNSEIVLDFSDIKSGVYVLQQDDRSIKLLVE